MEGVWVIMEPRHLPIHSLAESLGFSPSPRCYVAAFHLKTGFESQLFETREAKASRASQSKQAFGTFGGKETGLNFPSNSPGEKLRLLGGGGAGIWELDSNGKLKGSFGVIRKGPPGHSIAAPKAAGCGA